MDVVIDWESIPWEESKSEPPGYREKKCGCEGQEVWLCEISEGYNREGDWCTERHLFYVVAGESTLRFRDGDGPSAFGRATPASCLRAKPMPTRSSPPLARASGSCSLSSPERTWSGNTRETAALLGGGPFDVRAPKHYRGGGEIRERKSEAVHEGLGHRRPRHDPCGADDFVYDDPYDGRMTKAEFADYYSELEDGELVLNDEMVPEADGAETHWIWWAWKPKGATEWTNEGCSLTKAGPDGVHSSRQAYYKGAGFRQTA